MLKLDKQRRLKLPIDLIEISNLDKDFKILYIMLKGSDLCLSQNIDECFDGVLAKVTLDSKYRFVIPNRIINFLKLNENCEILLFVDKSGYIIIKAAN